MTARKLTLRQYRTQRAALEAQLARLEQQVEQMIAHYEDHPRDAINAVYDDIWDTEVELRDLEWDWDTRNWGAHEWTQWELITRNID